MDSELIAHTERQQLIQSMIYKSPIMWLVIFLWRWINSVSMMFIFMITVVFEKTDEYLNFVKSHGILILTTVTLITYIHYTYALAQISEIWLLKILWVISMLTCNIKGEFCGFFPFWLSHLFVNCTILLSILLWWHINVCNYI